MPERRKDMKQTYSAPTIEKIDFNYREQVVATSGGYVSFLVSCTPAG